MNEPTASRNEMVLERLVEASVEQVWQMWTVPEHFAAWYGPDGATVHVLEMDVRVGGRRHVSMEVATPAGRRWMWFAGEFVDVEANRRLVYTEFISDQEGEPVKDAGTEQHSITTEVRIELAERDGRTLMVLTHVGIAPESPGAVGWAMALDKLAAHVVVD